jgi:hypothetical protein
MCSGVSPDVPSHGTVEDAPCCSMVSIAGTSPAAMAATRPEAVPLLAATWPSTSRDDIARPQCLHFEIVRAQWILCMARVADGTGRSLQGREGGMGVWG